MGTLQVNEIFTSLSGEPDGFGNQGGLATFIRLQGCNLDCSWCDTQYASDRQTGAIRNMTVSQVLARCDAMHVIVTGGEPLLQKEGVKELIESLVNNGICVTVETNGSLVLPRLEFSDQGRIWRVPPVRYVVDYKLESSGMTKFMKQEIFDRLSCFDVIKFVIADQGDYKQAKILLAANRHWVAWPVFSPVLCTNPELASSLESNPWPAVLAKNIIQDRLEGVTFALQLHKLVDIK